ncbi:hypothetical protein GQ457_04G018350 [Hibiscus cannabinus]
MTGKGKELKKKKDTEKIESSLRENKEEDREVENSLTKPGKIKRVKGIIHTEDLWKARRCLVGMMNIVCSVRSIELRLQEWGLAEIEVKRLDGKSYLLAFDNDELYMMLEDVNWFYLKEIFLEIKPWSEKARFVERATWVELQGLPLHCWNHETIKKVAEQWGEFEALGENANMLLDCERVSVLITTSYEKKIEETVELEVGDEVYMVRASELRFKDVSQVKIQATENGEGRSDRQTKDSSSEATSADRTEEVNSQSHREEKEDALNAAVLGNSKNNYYSYDLVETISQLGESEMKGMGDKFHHLETQEQVTSVNEMKGEAMVSKTMEKFIGQVDVPTKDLEISNNFQESRVPTSDELSMRAREDLRDIGLGLEDKGLMVSVEGNSSQSQGLSRRPQDAMEFVNGVKNFELPELLYLTKISKKKERKFGSLSKIQDRFLSEVEKRKRDRSKKRLKKKEIEETISELEGRSITDSDIEAMRDILLKEAINTLAVGNTVGIKFIGDEQEERVGSLYISARLSCRVRMLLFQKQLDQEMELQVEGHSGFLARHSCVEE